MQDLVFNMRTFVKILAPSILCILFISCKEAEIYPHDYPFVTTIVKEVTEDGVFVEGIINDSGSSPIINVGFEIGTVGENSSYIVQAEIQGEKFSKIINSGILVGRDYWIRAFAENATHTTKGKEVIFTGKGASPQPPIFNEMTPLTISDHHLVTVYLDDLPIGKLDVQAKVGDEFVDGSRSLSGEPLITFLAPINNQGTYPVEIFINSLSVNAGNITYAFPEMVVLEPDSGPAGTIVEVSGEYLGGLRLDNRLIIKGKELTPTSIEPKKLTFEIPNTLTPDVYNVTFHVNGKAFPESLSFTVTD